MPGLLLHVHSPHLCFGVFACLELVCETRPASNKEVIDWAQSRDERRIWRGEQVATAEYLPQDCLKPKGLHPMHKSPALSSKWDGVLRMQKTGDLEINHDLNFERRSWKVER